MNIKVNWWGVVFICLSSIFYVAGIGSSNFIDNAALSVWSNS